MNNFRIENIIVQFVDKISLSLASGYIAHLIDQLGIQDYLDRYHQVGLPDDAMTLNYGFSGRKAEF